MLVLWIALYFLITYAPFFVLGPYIAKHSMGGAGSWGIVVTGEGIGALLGGLAGLRFRPRRPMVATGLLFLLTVVQSVLLALPCAAALLAPAAALAGFAFALGSVVWDTTLQRMIAPREARARRARTAGWARWSSCPPGTRSPGRSRRSSGCAAYLLFGAGWLVASTLVVVRLRSVREVTSEPARRSGTRGGVRSDAARPGAAGGRGLPRQAEPRGRRDRRPDGSPHTAATWYEWEDGRVLLNMARHRRRLEYMRIEPRAVSLTVLSDGDRTTT